MPLTPGTVVRRGDDSGAADVDRTSGIEMRQSQRLGIAATRIQRTGADLAIAPP